MKRVYIHITFVIALLLAAPIARAASAALLPDGFVRLEGCPFVVCSGSNDTTELRLSDEQFNALATGIIFEVNRTEIRPNQPFLRLFNDSVVDMLRRKGFRIQRLYVRGAASPEGPYDNNRRLGQGRTAALYQFLNWKLGETISMVPPIDRTTVIEDYARLVELMKAAGDRDAELVDSLMRRCDWNEACCKQALMNVRGGALWNRLKQQYFPELRAARVVIWVKKDGPVGDVNDNDNDNDNQNDNQNDNDNDNDNQNEDENENEEGVGGLAGGGVATADTAQVAQPADTAIAVLPTDTLPTQAVDTLSHDTIPVTHDTIPVTPAPIYRDTTWNRREMLSIKTNLLFDFAYVPKYGMAWILNAQMEYYPKHGHITPVISFDGPWWQNRAAEHKYFQVRNYQAEVRGYFRREDARYDGWYLGLYGHGMLYGIGFNGGEGYQGEGWGVGLSGGYVLPLIKGYRHLKLEFGIQVGYFRTKYDPYRYGCPVENVEDGLYYYQWTGKKEDFVERQWLWQWFGPTRIGITLTYDLLYRKHSDHDRPTTDAYNREMKGASFIWREKPKQE